MFYPDRIKIVTIYKKFFSNHDFFYKISSKSLINREESEPELEPELESEPQFIIRLQLRESI